MRLTKEDTTLFHAAIEWDKVLFNEISHCPQTKTFVELHAEVVKKYVATCEEEGVTAMEMVENLVALALVSKIARMGAQGGLKMEAVE